MPLKNDNLKFNVATTCALFDRSRLWLSSEVLKMQEEPIESGLLLTVIVGLWICEKGMEYRLPTPEFIACLELTERALRKEYESGLFRREKHDTKLMLLSQRLLESHGYRAPGIEQFTQELVEALSDPDSLNIPLVGERIILRSMGHNVPVGLVEHNSLRLSDYELLLSEKQQLRELCRKILDLTQYGSESKISEATLSVCTRTLPLIMCEVLRQYDLDLGTLMLRTLCCLPGVEDDALVASAVDFLARQQREDGSFGYFGNSIHEIEQAKCGDFRPFQDLYLPTTVACLWSLAEAFLPGLSLFSYSRSIPTQQQTQTRRFIRSDLLRQ